MNIIKFNNRIFFSILFIIIIFFFIYQSKNFKLDASSDTLILQNDESFKYYNYYNEIFPNKNFLVLAIQSTEEIDLKYLKKIEKIKKNLLKIKGIESILSINDIPILISNDIKLNELSDTINIETLKNTEIKIEKILDEFSNSPVFLN